MTDTAERAAKVAHPPKRRAEVDGKSASDLREMQDYTRSVAIRTACSLNVADHLAGGPRSAEALAADMSVNPRALYRLLRALGVWGIVSRESSGEFALGPAGQLLRKDHPRSLADACALSSVELQAWGALDESIRTGKSAFECAHGEDVWTFSDAQPREAARLGLAKRSLARANIAHFLDDFAWANVEVVVGIGGGSDVLVAALVAQFPTMKGVVLERPATIELAREVVAPVSDRCGLVESETLDEFPIGADVYVLHGVIGERSDEAAVHILSNLARALRAHSHIVVMDELVGVADTDRAAVESLRSCVLYGVPPRSADDYRDFLARVGLRMGTVVPVEVGLAGFEVRRP
jgi:hypothetical protein